VTTVSVNSIVHTVTITDSNSVTTVISVPETAVVSALTAGPQGIRGLQGEPGPAGPASAFFVYNQATAASEWTINHNLGFKPSVQAFDTGSQQIEGLVTHLSINTTAIVFVVPVAGFARLT